MKKSVKKLFAALTLALAFGFTLHAEDVTITLIETSDLHGQLAPWDYANDSAVDKGLTKVATIVKEERAKDPSLLLIDCGDNVQDNLIQEFRNDKIHPMINALNALKYDALVIGNHEFNFEFKNLEKNIRTSKAPFLGANIYKKNGKRFLSAYQIKKVNGVKVAIIGLTAPHVTKWEASDPSHYNYMAFTEIDEELGKVINEIGNKADVIVVGVHYGLDGEYGSTGMQEIAEKYGDKVSAFLIGHAHSKINQKASNGAVIVEPGSKGECVAKVTLTVSNDTGKWAVTESTGELIQVSGKNIPEDEEMKKIVAPTHEKSLSIARTVVGKVGADFIPELWWNGLKNIPTAVLQDTGMMDLINNVQMMYTGADVSLAALFSSNANLEAGDFRKCDGVKVYKYDNTLMAVNVTGAQLKAVMEEQAGKFFNTSKEGDVTISFDENIRLYNYDMFQGVDYEIDISQPVGSRIKNVMYKGEPLADDQKLVLALNNYRYGGLSTAGLISDKPEDIVYSSVNSIRDMIIDYVTEQGTIMPSCDNNWKITGFDFSANEETEKVYDLVRNGTIELPSSVDGRTPNVKSLNINELKAQGLLK